MQSSRNTQMTYHSEVSVHHFFVFHPMYKNTLFIPQRFNMSVANRMDKLHIAWEQEQFKPLCHYHTNLFFKTVRFEFKTPVNLM